MQRTLNTLARYVGARMTTQVMMMAAVLGLGLADAASAQGRGRGPQDVPQGHLPAAGECRVWHDDRPPGQQTAPTSCGAARATAAQTGGRVIYGEAVRRSERDRADGREDGSKSRKLGCTAKDRRKGKCGPSRRQRDARDRDARDRDARDARDRDLEDDREYDRERDREHERDRSASPDRSYPQSLPEMVWGVLAGRGDRPDAVRQWVGTDPLRVSVTDNNGDGRPEAVTWTDTAGRLVQSWVDENRDGRADRVTVYQNGKVLRTIR